MGQINQFYTGLLALLGVVLGGLVALASKWLEKKWRHKEYLNRVVFNLLNMHSYLTANIKIQLALLAVESKVEKDEYKERIKNIIRESHSDIDNLENNNYERMNEMYLQSIDEISQIDPLMAFELQSHADINSFRKISSMLKSKSDEESLKEFPVFGINMLEITKSRKKVVEDYLLKTSYQISFNKYFRIKKYIKDKRKKDDLYIGKSIKKFF